MLGLGGLGLGSIGLGLGMNALGMGSNKMGAVNADLARQQRNIEGGWTTTPGLGNIVPGLSKFGFGGQRVYQEGRADPQAGPAQLAQTSGFRQNQADLISRLEALSKGQGPSLAAEQLRQATDRNMRQQASIAQTGRGNAALAGITAANNSAQLGAQAASDSAVARIAEQQMALQQLGGAINQGRVADQDLSQFNALQQNFRDQFNVEAQLRARGMNDEQIRAIMQMRAGLAAQQDAQSFPNQLMAGGAGLLALQAQQGSNKKG